MPVVFLLQCAKGIFYSECVCVCLELYYYMCLIRGNGAGKALTYVVLREAVGSITTRSEGERWAQKSCVMVQRSTRN